MARILLIDDEADLLKALTMIIKSRGHDVTALPDALAASNRIQKEKFDIIISDIRMQPMDGLQLLEFIHQEQVKTPVIMLTAHATLDVALQAIKKGAFDFITKPFKPEALLELVEHVLEQPVINGSDISLDESLYRQWLWHGIAARSRQMKDVCNCLQRIAPTNETVLLMGEKGTGKRFIAGIIHALSQRSDKKFESLDCAALTEKEIHAALISPRPDSPGILEQNVDGTVFLENIDAVPAQIGLQLANIIQPRATGSANSQTQRRIDVRLLAGCCQPKKTNDWLQQLASFTVALQPLRERLQDLLPLISLLTHKYAAEHSLAAPLTIAGDAYKLLAEYVWPENIDELREILDSALASAQELQLTLADLPAWLVSEATNGGRSSSPSCQIEELRGKSFRDYVRRKQMEIKKKKFAD